MTIDQVTQDLAMIARNAIDLIIKLEREKQELLEALKFVIRGVPDTWEGVQKARAAIAKTEGGQE